MKTILITGSPVLLHQTQRRIPPYMAAIIRRHRFPIIVIICVLLLMLFSWFFPSKEESVVNSAPVSDVYKSSDDDIQLFAAIKHYSSDVTIISPNIEEQQPQVISIPKLPEDEESFSSKFPRKILKESTKYQVEEHFIPTQQEMNEFTQKLMREHEQKFMTGDGKESTKYVVDEHFIPTQQETNEFTMKLKREHEQKFVTVNGKESTKYVVGDHFIPTQETSEFTKKLKREHEQKFVTDDGKKSTRYIVDEHFIPTHQETNEFTTKLPREHEEKFATADGGELRIPVKLQNGTEFQSPSNIDLRTDTKKEYHRESPFAIPPGDKRVSLSPKKGLQMMNQEHKLARRDFVTIPLPSNGTNSKNTMSTSKNFLLNQPQPSALQSTSSTENSALLIDTPGCKVPKLDPWDPSVKDFIELQDPYICPGPQIFMSSNPDGSITLNETILKNYHNMTPEELVCHYRPIYRKYEEEGSDKEISISFGKLLMLDFGKPLDEDYVSVSCNVSGIRYEQHFPLVRLKDNVEDERNSIVPPKPTLNVILIGIDSVSKLNFLRHFPRTQAFFNGKLKSFEMNGYTKVGENTFPNLVPMLTGQFVEHWWNETVKNTMFFDNIGLIWKEYAKRGYRTFYAEDSPFVGSFHYLKRGFYDPPTDYYYRPLALALEMWKFQAKPKEFCINSQIDFDIIYNYLKDFTQAMGTRPFFGFAMVSTITHDNLNYAGWADEPTVRLLEDLLNTGALNNTLLVLFSDHGLRFGEIRNTYIGKFEERLPLMYIHVPKWFLETYPEIAKNLEINQDRLMTLFDIHATMLHLLDLNRTHKERSMVTLGRSIFEEISPDRTCKDANIETHFCPCQEFDVVELNSSEAINASLTIIDDINSKLEPYRRVCELLKVDKIIDARVGKANNIMLRYLRTENEVINRTIYVGDDVAALDDYMITLIAKPGGGVFEGTVRHNVENNTYNVLGISRISMYGTTSWCIDSQKLKLFCYCKFQKQF